jgi:hypothetical protein
MKMGIVVPYPYFILFIVIPNQCSCSIFPTTTRNFWSFHHHQIIVWCVAFILGQIMEPKAATIIVLSLDRPWSLVCEGFLLRHIALLNLKRSLSNLNINRWQTFTLFFFMVFSYASIYRTSIRIYQVYNTKIKFVFNPPHPPHPAPPQSPPPPPFEISAHSPAQSIQPSK